MLADRSIRWVPTSVAARELGISRQAVRGLMKRGRLAGEYVGNQWLVSVGTIEAYGETKGKRGQTDDGDR
jgi:predicted DNA-binding transcriptional regulator